MMGGNDRIRVAFVFPQLEWGGPFKGVLAILKHLDRRRFEPSFIALSAPIHADARAAVEGLDCPYVELGQHGFKDVRALPRLAREVRRRGTRILHSTLVRPDWYAVATAAVTPGLRVLTTVRGMDDNAIRILKGRAVERVFSGVNRQVLRRMDRVVPHSLGLAEYVRRMGVAESRIRLIRNGLDLEPFEGLDRPAARRALRATMGWPDDATVVGFVATLWPYKDHRGFVEAAGLLHRDRPGLRFVVAGEGPMLEELRAFVHRRGLDGVVAYPGHVRDIANFHAGLDLHLFLSFSEGLPRAVLESQAAGVPVVATAIPGVDEVVVDGVTGLMVPVGDPVAAAEATARLLDDAALRQRLCAEAGLRVRGTWSAAAMARAYEALYDELR